MKYLKSFNEAQEIKYKNLQETIDEVLDSLSEKGKLSDSEKEFMEAVSKDEVKNVTTPTSTGNFWADVSNPHNMGIMWQNKNGEWKKLEELPILNQIDFKEKDFKHLNGMNKDDQEWEAKKILERKKILKENPGLREDLVKLLNMFIMKELEETSYIKGQATKLLEKWRKPYSEDNYKFNQIIDCAFNGTFHSLINQFGYWEGPSDFDFVIYNED